MQNLNSNFFSTGDVRLAYAATRAAASARENLQGNQSTFPAAQVRRPLRQTPLPGRHDPSPVTHPLLEASFYLECERKK